MKKTFKQRLCTVCSTLFIPKGPKTKTCSILCRLLASCDKPSDENACWNWKLAVDKAGYGYLKCDCGVEFAHREMYKAVHKCELSSSDVIRHSCDNPPCINPAHLVAGTQADNVKDMWERKRQQTYKKAAKGMANSQSKLTNELVMEIYLAEGTYKSIADRVGISSNTVERIKGGASWTHITNAPFTLGVGRRKGSANPEAKLTEQEVLEIFNSKEPLASLSKHFDVSMTTASLIKRGKTWKHITQTT